MRVSERIQPVMVRINVEYFLFELIATADMCLCGTSNGNTCGISVSSSWRMWGTSSYFIGLLILRLL